MLFVTSMGARPQTTRCLRGLIGEDRFAAVPADPCVSRGFKGALSYKVVRSAWIQKSLTHFLDVVCAIFEGENSPVSFILLTVLEPCEALRVQN